MKRDEIVFFLTHWGRVTHICVGKLTIIGSDNGLSPERRQAIFCTNAGILLFGPLRTNFSEILVEIQTFSLKKIRSKMSFAKWCLFRLGLNVLSQRYNYEWTVSTRWSRTIESVIVLVNPATNYISNTEKWITSSLASSWCPVFTATFEMANYDTLCPSYTSSFSHFNAVNKMAHWGYGRFIWLHPHTETTLCAKN